MDSSARGMNPVEMTIIKKIFVKENLHMVQMKRFISQRVENILGKGENAGTSIFSFSQNVYKSPFHTGLCVKGFRSTKN